MNRSVKKQQHEQARKRHKHDAEQQARELAKRPKSKFPMVLLGVVVATVIAIVVLVIATR